VEAENGQDPRRTLAKTERANFDSYNRVAAKPSESDLWPRCPCQAAPRSGRSPHRGSTPAMGSNREATCHLLAADFPRHSRSTERCWTQSGGRCGARGRSTLLGEGLGQGERLQTLPLTSPLLVARTKKLSPPLILVPGPQIRNTFRAQPTLLFTISFSAAQQTRVR
jgi:hypothetical protein